MGDHVGIPGVVLLLLLLFNTILTHPVLLAKIPNPTQEQPYQDDSTASRLLSEVKHLRVVLVLRWGTTLESAMFFFLLPFKAPFGIVSALFDIGMALTFSCGVI